jgi:hypothetical protein
MLLENYDRVLQDLQGQNRSKHPIKEQPLFEQNHQKFEIELDPYPDSTVGGGKAGLISEPTLYLLG